jgi:hypothetical protein
LLILELQPREVDVDEDLIPCKYFLEAISLIPRGLFSDMRLLDLALTELLFCRVLPWYFKAFSH